MEDPIDRMLRDAMNPEYQRSMAAKLDHDLGVPMSKPDDAIFRALAAGYPMHMMWRMSLPAMWDDVAHTRTTSHVYDQRTERRSTMSTCFHTEHIDGRCVKCGWVLDHRRALIVEARRKHCTDCDHFIAAMADELERLTT